MASLLSVCLLLMSHPVQYAGNKNPFLVTVILCCTQILSMIATATLTDTLGRRPLTVYPYAVTVVSVLCLGIVGCFDYTTKALSSLLVCSPRPPSPPHTDKRIPDFLCLLGNVLDYRRLGYWVCLRRGNPSTATACTDSWVGSGVI